MKKLKILLGVLVLLIFNISATNLNIEKYNTGCGKYNGKITYKGSKGGCYYLNSKSKKVYVDSKYCPC